jgi:hypothetical protein|tara:strand:+ start:59 stop:253 length:195 start_codon:yes stop_codon:yes gene_type:complete
MKTYTKHDYEYGDLVVLVRGKYNKIKIGEIGIIKERYGGIANIQFANTSGAFGYEQFVPLEVIA